MGVLSLIFARPKLLLGLITLTVVVSVYLMFCLISAERDQARAALAHTRDLLAAAQDQSALNHLAINAADHSQRIDTHSRSIVAETQHALVLAEDAHTLFAAWHDGVMRVRNDAGSANA